MTSSGKVDFMEEPPVREMNTCVFCCITPVRMLQLAKMSRNGFGGGGGGGRGFGGGGGGFGGGGGGFGGGG